MVSPTLHLDVVVLDGDCLGFLALDEGALDRGLVLRFALLCEQELVAFLVELFLGEVDSQFALVLEALLLEPQFSGVTNSFDCVDRLDSLLPQIAVVSNRSIPLFLKIKGGIESHLLALQPTRGLSPLHLAGVVLAFEMLVAF